MIYAVIAVVALAVILLAVGATRLLRHREEPGVATFRRHIDALSPEARREVADRVQRQRDEADGADGADEADRD